MTQQAITPINTPRSLAAAQGNSKNYAVGFGYTGMSGGTLPKVTIPDGLQVQSAMFTNTTYAAIVMRDGDIYGTPAFTRADWFKLTITGQNASGVSIGTVDFYLAQNNNVVDTWQSVDLSSLSGAKTLVFDLASTSHNAYGMLTPGYFAMDNLTFSSVPEPSTIALLIVAALAYGVRRWNCKTR